MHLLVAIDHSAHSQSCIREIAARPWPEGTQVRVLSVTGLHPGAPLPDAGMPAATTMHVPPPGVSSIQTQAHAMESARSVAQDAADVLARHGLAVQIRVREGTPATQIVEEARAWPADLILVGTRDRSGLRRALFGSVASYVLHHAPCSVEVVRQH
jgi:nucleotide-binding universal stress UspA family protein